MKLYKSFFIITSLIFITSCTHQVSLENTESSFFESENSSSSFEESLNSVSSEDSIIEDDLIFSYPFGENGYNPNYLRSSPRKNIDCLEILEFGSYTKNNRIIFNWSGTSSEIYDLVIVTVSSDSLITKDFYVYERDHITFELPTENRVYSFTFTPIQLDLPFKQYQVYRYVEPLHEATGLPCLKVETGRTKGYNTKRNHCWPTADYVSSPLDIKWGPSIIDNKYVSGSKVRLQNKDQKEIYNGVNAKIKLRGNSSAYSAKKPYKIRLDEPFDLLSTFIPGRQSDTKNHAHTDWILLAKGTQIYDFLGQATGRYVGQDYNPEMAYIDLYINGDYQGIYLLSESIARGDGRVNVSSSGYILENDGLFWCEDLYFKTRIGQTQPVGYTFKYPDPETLTAKSEKFQYIENYIIEFESKLYSSGDDYLNYVDELSFVKWILCHDLLGTWDSGGSNMFITKYDNTTSSKLQAGPIWDLDSAGMMGSNQFARVRNEDHYYIKQFLTKSSFVNKYVQLLKEKLPLYISFVLNTLSPLDGKSINKSIQKDAIRWLHPNDYKLIDELSLEYISYIYRRLDFLRKTFNL